MILAVLRLYLALAHPFASPEWTDERAHVECYALGGSDTECSDAVDPAPEPFQFDWTENFCGSGE